MPFHCRTLTVTPFILLLAACSVGPDYVRPSVNVPKTFKEAKGHSVISASKSKEWKVAQPNDACYRGAWWKIFNDPTLNQLESQLTISNQTIINAEENYQQAASLVNEARANFFPTVSGSLALTRQKQGGGSTTFVSSSSSGTSTGTATAPGLGGGTSLHDSHSWLLNASWEPDIWGNVRRTVEASAANAQSIQALLAVTRLSAQASLAQYYFELRGLDTDQQLLNKTVLDDKKTLALTKNQYASGVAARADVVQAQSQLEVAQAGAINNGILRAQYEHAIAVLIGKPPVDFSLSPHPLNATPPAIPLTVPSVLLERRPDVAQAERLMAQANAQIGVAISAYYPNLSLTGSGSVGENTLGNLFNVPSAGWALGTQLAETILDGGLRSSTIYAARSGYKASVANYRQVILAAFQDVEDNLASLRILNAEYVVQKAAATSANTALTLVINQYRAGTVPYSSVLTAQIAAYTAEKNAVDINYLRMTSAVGLIKALGGGWDSDET